MKKIACCIALLFVTAVSARDYRVTPRDNDTLINCTVGDTISAEFPMDANLSCDDMSVLTTNDPTYSRGAYHFTVTSAGAASVHLQKCMGRKGCRRLQFHVQATEKQSRAEHKDAEPKSEKAGDSKATDTKSTDTKSSDKSADDDDLTQCRWRPGKIWSRVRHRGFHKRIPEQNNTSDSVS